MISERRRLLCVWLYKRRRFGLARLVSRETYAALRSVWERRGRDE